MKLNSQFLLLLLIISIKSNNLLDSFSIESFKDYLKANGLFEIIQSIKYVYGQDVAIISCEELNKNYNGNCKKLVTDYMKEKIENTNVGAHGLIAEFNKNSENSVERSIASSQSENRDEEIIASSQSKEGSSKSYASIGQNAQHPKKSIKQSLNNKRNIMKHSIEIFRKTIKKIFKPNELKPIKYKIKRRVEKLPLFKNKDEFFKYLDSLLDNE